MSVCGSAMAALDEKNPVSQGDPDARPEGFTVRALKSPRLRALLRILDAQKACVPALYEEGAALVRASADDLVALFDEPSRAIDAAFEVHRRLAAFNHSRVASY